jgi:hypothetical protein
MPETPEQIIARVLAETAARDARPAIVHALATEPRFRTAGRRILDRGTVIPAACGGEPTRFDLTPDGARRNPELVTCPACRAVLGLACAVESGHEPDPSDAYDAISGAFHVTGEEDDGEPCPGFVDLPEFGSDEFGAD